MYSNRFVIDEQLFQFRDQQGQIIEENLLALADLLEQFQEREIEVLLPRNWQDVRYVDGELFVNHLYSGITIERDLRVRLQKHLNKCVDVDIKNEYDFNSIFEIQNMDLNSYGIAFALYKNTLNYATAVVTANYMNISNIQLVIKAKKRLETHFVRQFSETINLFRSIFQVDNIKEVDFFKYTTDAFPNLIFSQNLNFNKFKGSYELLRTSVVEHLGALNDRFISAFDSENGLPVGISSVIGISVSIESGNTRDSRKKMKLREVEFQGRMLMCEWHSKIEPQQNRIHFCLIRNEDNARIFIGIFVEHLPT